MKIKYWYNIFCPKLFKNFLNLESKVGIDFLTGLKSRVEYEREIDFIFSQNKNLSRDLFYIFLDVDNFKKVNDTYGHRDGDLFLKKISDVLRNNLRNFDKIYRFADDEFILILNRIKNDDLEKKLVKINREVFSIYKDLNISLSMGVVKINFKIDDQESILEKADDAMYEAKKRGKNQIVFYEEIENK